MVTTTPALIKNETLAGSPASDQTRLYRLGGTLALLIVLTVLLEIAITFLPGGYASTETVRDWFVLLQNNWFLGLRNLGLLNIVMTLLGVPMYLALYAAHHKNDPSLAGLALALSMLGAAVFFATNRAFPMLDLSHQYAAASTEAERALLAAAGQALLSVGQSHTPGTFLAFLLSEIAGILTSVVMLRGRLFSALTAWAGILAFGLLLVFEICASFVTALSVTALGIAMAGGLLNIAWYILTARRFFQLAKAS